MRRGRTPFISAPLMTVFNCATQVNTTFIKVGPVLANFGVLEKLVDHRVAHLAGGELPRAAAGISPPMASPETVTGYDPLSMQIISMDTAQSENLLPSEDELLDDMVRLWRSKPNSVRCKRHESGSDQLIVVLKPRATLDLKVTFVPGQAGPAVRNLIRDCGEVELNVWPVWDPNVLLCGLVSVPCAKRLFGDVMLVVGSRQHPFRGRAKASGGFCKGVINIDPNDTSISLKQKLGWKHANILCVRKLGNTDFAVVTFEGKGVPRYVYCSNQLIPVRLYKKTIPACHRCGTAAVGTLWSLWLSCAITSEGPAEHECNRHCLICGGSHLTGAADCRDMYRKPIKPRLPPSTNKRTSPSKGASSAKVNNKKKSPSTPGNPRQVKTTNKAETRTQAPTFNA
ncbi:hypothetical protein HPB50_009861 [Hyalomma asiaticum]|uniref:Uncharacterized protein n=1 Tax=Hyalomma asiaticum TaxID=266040 RepID=A0ACB7RUA5_HYAAI|nr:hypothetical protein HPB50_009861 [Hyalomma asiaticum]